MKMMQKKLFVTFMLVTPIALFSIFFTYMVREANARHSAKEAARAKQLALPAVLLVNGVPVGNLNTELTPAPVAAQQPPAPSAPTAPAAPQAGAKLVRPESLEQGYIIIVKDLAGLASPASPIFLASSFNGWDPSDVKQKLTSRSDLRWQIIMPKAKADAGIAFKFTRGNWDREELKADLTVPDNRSLPLIDPSKLKPGEQPVFEFEVPKWGDMRPASGARPDLDPYHDIASKATIRRLQVTGGGVDMATSRDLLVMLPKGYDAPENISRNYRVLYMMDGQNLFEPLPSLPAEWGVDETLTSLDDFALADPIIVVGIPNAGKGRMSEYQPYGRATAPFHEPRGKQFLAFLTGEVMPRVQRAFRVKEGPENTGIGGSSMGALIAMYAACERPDLFGKVLAESLPDLDNVDTAAGVIFSEYTKFPEAVYLGVGTAEYGATPSEKAANDVNIKGFKALEAMIKQKSPGTRLMATIDENATHNEVAWAKRFPEAMKFLFPRHVRD